LDASITQAQERGHGNAEIAEIVVACVPGVDPDKLRKEILKAADPARPKTPPERAGTSVAKTRT
jgi:hypothetical protein